MGLRRRYIRAASFCLLLVGAKTANALAIFGDDDRVQMTNTDYPWRAIGKVWNKTGICTGTLIGPCQVLTAAHCIDNNDKSDAGDDTVKEWPIHFRGSNMGPMSDVKHVYYGRRSQGRNHDWAVLILNERLGDKLGWLQLERRSTDYVRRNPFIVAGYSTDLYAGNSASADQNVTLFIDNSDLIWMVADTYYGSSGAAIWYWNGNVPKVIGVNTRMKPYKFASWSDADLSIGVATDAFWTDKNFQDALAYCKK